VRRPRPTTAGIMAVIALVALDCLAGRALSRAPTDEAVYLGLVGALPTANALAIGPALAAGGLLRRGECRLSSVGFVACGGAALLLYAACVMMAPGLLLHYLGATVAPVFDAARRLGADVSQPIWDSVEIPLVWAVVTPSLLLPAVIGAWLGRRHRIRLVIGPRMA
jgi:hypothetical protein